jgi:hypothetical protein
MQVIKQVGIGLLLGSPLALLILGYDFLAGLI